MRKNEILAKSSKMLRETCGTFRTDDDVDTELERQKIELAEAIPFVNKTALVFD